MDQASTKQLMWQGIQISVSTKKISIKYFAQIRNIKVKVVETLLIVKASVESQKENKIKNMISVCDSDCINEACSEMKG